MQKIVSLTERALKLVSDAMAEQDKSKVKETEEKKDLSKERYEQLIRCHFRVFISASIFIFIYVCVHAWTEWERIECGGAAIRAFFFFLNTVIALYRDDHCISNSFSSYFGSVIG